MSETSQEYVIAQQTNQQPAEKTTQKSGEQSQSYRIGNKIVRIDAASIETAPDPHLPASLYQTEIVTSRDSAAGTIEMGMGNVRENNSALQQARAEMERLEQEKLERESQPEPVVNRALKIQPSWEVEYFRWPRLSRRLLKTQQPLFDQIGGQLLYELQPTQMRIGVCSTFPREGKTTIAICLARWAAMKGKRTLLIDADVERPKMTAICGLDCAFGWQAILDSDIPPGETMIRSVESGLVFMPSRTEGSPLIVNKSIDQMSSITFQMKYEFDIVVVDMGTIENICAHGTESMDVVDAMLVTRDPSRTSVGQMMDTRRVLNNLGITKTYVAQNFARRDVA